MEGIIQSIVSALSGVPAELVVFLISLCPILELRGGLIAASILGVDMWKAIFCRYPLFFCLLKKYLNCLKIQDLSR